MTCITKRKSDEKSSKNKMSPEHQKLGKAQKYVKTKEKKMSPKE